MSDQELAEKIVAVGVGRQHETNLSVFICHSEDLRCGEDEMGAEFFVRSWLVAGAMMEKCIGLTVAELEVDSGYGRGWEVYNTFAPGTNKSGGQDYRYTKANDESLPRAINEACAEALS